MKKPLLIIFVLFPYLLFSQIFLVERVSNLGKYFPIVHKNEVAAIYYDTSENVLIKRSAAFLADDIERVTGKKPIVTTTENFQTKYIIIIATIGKNPIIEKLIATKKVNVDPIKGQWEHFLIQTIDKPFPGVEKVLLILGSDRRGAAYGVFTLSEAIGVSPWYWWADVPVKRKENVYIESIKYFSDGPKVKYRGIFINDEAPALRNWAKEKFGGFNHKFYEKVFELLLRLKANYLWPAMWLPTAFADDDPENPRVADEYGIVISTSHHEPMMRAHHEWIRFKGGVWDYTKNKERLQAFWRGGIERMGNYESVVTVGMRGDGDEPMTEETAVDLLKTIIADQRKILTEVTGKPANEIPQVWAVYKEVQDYYEKGMRVDDDITILFCDDNWGNLRILPKKEDLNRKGGYGIYYHFDYVGAPVSYRWQNVTQIERVWEQMNLAYVYGVKTLWIVNVGDIKPMEFPISFFMDYAWNPDAIQAKDLPGYYSKWTKNQFGNTYANEIANILSLYTKYNARRTPEMLKPDTYSIENYREADRVLNEWKELFERSQKIYSQLSDEYKPAYFQLIYSPIEMRYNVIEMYITAGKNKLYAEQGRASANLYAEKVKELFWKDQELTRQFHENLLDGKWNHMMSQTHIGYTSWNHPRTNIMPSITYIHPKDTPQLGYVIEHGTPPAWGGHSVEGNPLFSETFSYFDCINQQSYYIEVFNMGKGLLEYFIETKNEWIKLSKTNGKIQYDERIFVSIDWEKAPKENVVGELVIKGAGKEYTVKVPIRSNIPEILGFVENNGVVSIEAPNFSRKVETKDIKWTMVFNLGRTYSSVIAEPVDVPSQKLSTVSPRLEYDFTMFDAGEVTVMVYVSPTQDFKKQGGLRYAVSIDDEEPVIVNINEGEIVPDFKYADWWMKSVADHIKIKTSRHKLDKPGKHTLKIWMIDTGIVFQKIVINAGGLKQSYLGPEESLYVRR